MNRMKRNLWKLSVIVTFGILMLVNRGDAAKGGVAVRVPPFVPVPGPQLGLQTLSPFQVLGFIQSATLDNASDVFSGGTVTVNGITITVPRNTLFQMPATSLTWQELFKNAPAPYGLTTNPPSTGLALND